MLTSLDASDARVVERHSAAPDLEWTTFVCRPCGGHHSGANTLRLPMNEPQMDLVWELTAFGADVGELGSLVHDMMRNLVSYNVKMKDQATDAKLYYYIFVHLSSILYKPH